jgi:hypothetical protein
LLLDLNRKLCCETNTRYQAVQFDVARVRL